MRIILLVGHLVALVGCAATSTQRLKLPPLEAVAQVDLDRYVGTWFEIASFPQRYQEGCTGTMATYTVRSDGDIDVLNRCREGSLNGELRSASGRARVADMQTNAKLQVSFFRPFWGDYWIIDLDEDYQYAVIGHPGRDYLWVLSRTPTMEETTYWSIIDRLKTSGYDPSRLVRTEQQAVELVQSVGFENRDLPPCGQASRWRF